MVKYLFVIFYLCVVMFLNQKARHVVMSLQEYECQLKNVTINKTEVDHQTYFPR